jgi:hypothetical protein
MGREEFEVTQYCKSREARYQKFLRDSSRKGCTELSEEGMTRLTAVLIICSVITVF